MQTLKDRPTTSLPASPRRSAWWYYRVTLAIALGVLTVAVMALVLAGLLLQLLFL
jgi:hypothetical protein